VPSSDPVQRFTDILDSIVRIRRFVAGMDIISFANSEQTVHAVKYALLIISEAAIKLDETATNLCPGIPWREVRGLGNRLRHEYDTIDVMRIWFLIERDLPPLAAACEEAIQSLSDPPP
jgi:uncharacterized protein with HEPN domain